MYRPGQGGQGYVPGGGQGYVPGGGQQPQPARNSQPNLNPQQRPLGSLQRRLQRSQASSPDGYDDQDDGAWGDDRSGYPGERARRSRPLDSPGERHGSQGQRRSSNSGENYGDRDRRSRPSDNPPARRDARASTSGRDSRDGRDRRGSRDGRDSRDGRGYYDESREEPAYSPYPAHAPDESHEYTAWDASAEGPIYEPPRRQNAPERQERYRPMDESAEISAEGPAYSPPRRSTPRRRSQPADDQRGDWNDFSNPLDDPRSPLHGGRSGSQGRRPSQGSGRSAPRPQRRPADDYPGYTEGEMDAPGIPNARHSPRHADNTPARRGPRGWDSDYGAPYEPEGDFASREGWAAPSGYTHAPYSEYQSPPSSRGQRAATFEESAEIWQPMGAAGRAATPAPSRSRRGGDMAAGAKPAKKRKGAVRTAFSLLTTLALIAALGVEFGPKVYHLILARGGIASTQQTITCATETTPQTKPAAGQTAFATSAYTLTYPATWQKTTRSGPTQGQCDVVYQFAQPNGSAQLNVEEAGAFTPLSDLQVIQAEAQSAQKQGSGFTEITSAATTQTIGGEVWQRREYQATIKNGVKVHLALLAGHHKGAGFAIFMLSTDTGFASDDTTVFEPILNSFKFT